MAPHPLIKFFIIAVLVMIIGALGSAFWTLFRKREQGTAAVKALTLRVGLSMGLFAVLMILYALGIIEPNG